MLARITYKNSSTYSAALDFTTIKATHFSPAIAELITVTASGGTGRELALNFTPIEAIHFAHALLHEVELVTKHRTEADD